MNDKGVAITETIQALGEFRSFSIGRGSSDLFSIDPFAPCFLQRLLLAFAVLLSGAGSPVTPDRYDYPVESLSEL